MKCALVLVTLVLCGCAGPAYDQVKVQLEMDDQQKFNREHAAQLPKGTGETR